jgi:transcriptional regulator with XRE-family HTH domain
MKMQERIRRARRRAGLSQAGLAELVNVRRSAVSNWESDNDALPSMQNLLAVAKACNVSLEWLGTGRGGISLDADAFEDVPTANAELVDVEEERMLLAGFRNLPRNCQQLTVDLVAVLQTARRRAGSP